jgi:hypothetical protein
MWIGRDAEKVLRRMAGQFPAVLVTGARQVGKTSLLRHLYPHASYLTLDFPAHAEAARTAPEDLLDRFRPPVIIDEIQYAPSLLRYVKVRIDGNRKPGRFLLTGSQAFALMEGASESLAGRCGVLQLHTLSYAEARAAGRVTEETAFVQLGGYPELHVGADPVLWFPSYVATYLERDVRNILRVVDLQDFHRFARVCSLRNAQILNHTDAARGTGVAPNTARKWLGLLQTSGIVDLVEPFFGNRTKRLIKSPKLMFLDTGLAAFLAGFRSAEALFASPHAGAFWESHVYGQLVRWYAARGQAAAIYFWRTVSGQEVDLVVELAGGAAVGIECKYAEHVTTGEYAGLNAFAAAEKGRVAGTFVACRTKATYRLDDGTWVTDVAGLLKRIGDLERQKA